MIAQHILSYAQTLAGGGVERALLRMAGGWIAAGRRVTLVVGSRAGPLAAELPEGLEIVDLGDPRQAALLRALPGIVRKLRPDVIFCAGNHYSGIAAWTRMRLGRGCPPIVAKVSNALVRRDMGAAVALGYRRWLRLHPNFLDAVVAMTPASAKEARAAMPGVDVHVIANPPAQPVEGAEPVVLPAERYLLGVGRLAPQKRWERLIAALPKLADRSIALVILGEGGQRNILEALVAALGLQDRVSLPGHAADPLPAIAGAAVVALTSDFEGVPGVLREAASVGTPVVATESSVAVREIVAPDGGTVVPVGDEAALVAALDDWLGGRPRPAPVIAGGDPVADYLALFDSLASSASS
jgi:glycosyltransferase involved in cell wall biosynthesis